MDKKLHLIFKELGPLHKKNSRSIDTEKEAVDAWFKGLHLINAEESLETISRYLSQANQLQIPLDERKYLLNLLYEPVISLAGHIKKSYLDTKFPLSSTERSKVDHCIAAYELLIIGHSIVLFEEVESRKSVWSIVTKNDKQLAVIIQQITRFLTQIVLTQFEVYSQAKPIIWDKLYSLYHYAEVKGIESILVRDEMLHSESSIQLTFLQALLLALSDPFHFNQQQIYFIYRHLAQWSKLVEITSTDKANEENFLAVNLTDTFMPTFYPRGVKPDSDYMLFLDSHQLTMDKINESQESTVGFLSPKIKEGLLSQLKVSLAVFVEREHNRREFFSEIKVVMGLNHVHYVLNGYEHPTWINNASFDSKFEENVDEAIDYTSLVINATPLSPHKAPEPLSIETFLTENESLNGLSLVWVNDKRIKINIGEVIAISQEKSDKPKNWSVGVIRRLQHIDNEPLKVGIQILSPSDAKAIGVQPITMPKKYRALYLPSFNLFNKNETLLTDALTFSQGEKLTINSCNAGTNRASREVSLLKNTETTSFYMRFNLKRISLSAKC